MPRGGLRTSPHAGRHERARLLVERERLHHPELHPGKEQQQAGEQEVLTRAKEAARDADGYVREHPWQAVGIAAGVGLLLGILISRR